MTKRALVLGISGQDGSYLADILLEKGYQVHGMIRRSSVDNTVRIKHVLDRVILHHGDLTDYGSLQNAILASNPDEIYNEADQDAVFSEGGIDAEPSIYVSRNYMDEEYTDLIDPVILTDETVRTDYDPRQDDAADFLDNPNKVIF